MEIRLWVTALAVWLLALAASAVPLPELIVEAPPELRAEAMAVRESTPGGSRRRRGSPVCARPSRRSG